MARFILRVCELLVVSCVVELAMTLPMAIYFHRITIFALPVNVFILPLLAVLMPAALLTLVALWVWPAAAVAPAMTVALVLHLGVGLVHLFGSLTFGDFRIPRQRFGNRSFSAHCWQPQSHWLSGLFPLQGFGLKRAGRGGWRGQLCCWRRLLQSLPGPLTTQRMRCYLKPSTWARATRYC